MPIDPKTQKMLGDADFWNVLPPAWQYKTLENSLRKNDAQHFMQLDEENRRKIVTYLIDKYRPHPPARPAWLGTVEAGAQLGLGGGGELAGAALGAASPVPGGTFIGAGVGGGAGQVAADWVTRKLESAYGQPVNPMSKRDAAIDLAIGGLGSWAFRGAEALGVGRSLWGTHEAEEAFNKQPGKTLAAGQKAYDVAENARRLKMQAAEPKVTEKMAETKAIERVQRNLPIVKPYQDFVGTPPTETERVGQVMEKLRRQAAEKPLDEYNSYFRGNLSRFIHRNVLNDIETFTQSGDPAALRAMSAIRDKLALRETHDVTVSDIRDSFLHLIEQKNAAVQLSPQGLLDLEHLEGKLAEVLDDYIAQADKAKAVKAQINYINISRQVPYRLAKKIAQARDVAELMDAFFDDPLSSMQMASAAGPAERRMIADWFTVKALEEARTTGNGAVDIGKLAAFLKKHRDTIQILGLPPMDEWVRVNDRFNYFLNLIRRSPQVHAEWMAGIEDAAGKPPTGVQARLAAQMGQPTPDQAAIKALTEPLRRRGDWAYYVQRRAATMALFSVIGYGRSLPTAMYLDGALFALEAMRIAALRSSPEFAKFYWQYLAKPGVFARSTSANLTWLTWKYFLNGIDNSMMAPIPPPSEEEQRNAQEQALEAYMGAPVATPTVTPTPEAPQPDATPQGE